MRKRLTAILAETQMMLPIFFAEPARSRAPLGALAAQPVEDHKKHGSGCLSLLRRAARSIATSIYQSDTQYITGCVPRALAREQLGIDCLVFESVRELEEIEHELPPEMPVDKLKARLAEGCIAFLPYRPSGAGSKEFVGFSIRERGIFSALGRKIPLSSNILFGHYLEVFPPYRGQRLAEEIRLFGEIYCHRNGLTKLCTVISAKNKASMQSHRHARSRMLGAVRKISLLRGLYVWETPVEEIKRAIASLDETAPSNTRAGLENRSCQVF